MVNDPCNNKTNKSNEKPKAKACRRKTKCHSTDELCIIIKWHINKATKLIGRQNLVETIIKYKWQKIIIASGVVRIKWR